jgi:hypothetical protein
VPLVRDAGASPSMRNRRLLLLMACNRLVTGFVSLKLVTAVITTGTALKQRLKGRDCNVPERAASTLPASISVPSARVYVPRSKTRKPATANGGSPLEDEVRHYSIWHYWH